MKLIEYLQNCGSNMVDIDLLIGDVEMPATVSWDNDEYHITDYCRDKYGDILDAEINIISEDDMDGIVYYASIEVLGDLNYRKGEEFVVSITGYVGINEYEKLFGGSDSNDN